jgi:hypothetical protein
MRRVWATAASVWAMLAIIAVLAWARPPAPRPLAQPAGTTLLIKGKHGTQRVLVVGSAGSAAPHATTQTSPVPVG